LGNVYGFRFTCDGCVQEIVKSEFIFQFRIILFPFNVKGER